MKTAIGGDRLGSGNKENVSFKNYSRSSHDLSYTWRSSMAPGTLVPFMSELALPGDNWKINLNCEVLTLPTVGPLFGSFKVQLDVFQVPIRLYNARLHMNELGIGMNMDDVKLPLVEHRFPWQTAITPASVLKRINQMNPSSVWSYLGFRGIGTPGGDPEQFNDYIYRNMNAVPYLGYTDIFKQYYANRQEENAYVICANQGNLEPPLLGAYSISSLPFSQRVNHFNEENAFLENASTLYLEFGAITDEPNAADIDAIIDSVAGKLTDILENFEWNPDTGIMTCTGTGSGTVQLEIPSQNVTIADLFNWDRVRLTEFPLKNIDDMRKLILRHPDDDVAFIVGPNSPSPYNLYRTTTTNPDGINPNAHLYSQQGLYVKTYQSDLFNNWIDTEWIDGDNGVNAITAVDTTGDSFTIDALNLASKVYYMLNRIAISGGSYDDWLDAVYTHERRKSVENPVYMGSLIKELAFQEVVSNSLAENEQEKQPLGTLAGRGRLTSKNKGGQIMVSVDEPSYIMGIVSITPRVDYSQGNKWDVNLETLDDLHKPALDAIGFQDLITDQLSYRDSNVNNTGIVSYKSAGKQPAWINYMTSVNRTYGNFAEIDKDMFMTLNRRYEDSLGIEDLTTYIDPSKYNFIFAQTDLSAQNFWVQISNNITARRKMSAKIIPNL